MEDAQAVLALCPFLVMSSVTAHGEPELTPCGGDPGLVRVLDGGTLLLPDRAGNDRLDSLRAVAAHPRAALLCFVPGIDDTLRVYGRAELLPAEQSPVDVIERGRPPRSVLLVHVDKAFLHCAEALVRGRLWDPEAQVPREAFPPSGEVLRAHTGLGGPVESQEDMRRRYKQRL